MKTTLQKIATNLDGQAGINYKYHFRVLASSILLLLLLAACSDDNAPNEDPEAIHKAACKKRPGQISFGRDTSDIVYNMQDKPIKITNAKYNIAAPSEPPVITVYTIEYNTQGNATKVTKSVNDQVTFYYKMDYNSDGKLVKQSEFNAQGTLMAYTTAQYDTEGLLTKITTHTEGTSVEVTSLYHYEDGNLIKNQ